MPSNISLLECQNPNMCNWRVVTAEQVKKLPYAAVGLVRVRELAEFGTCWLAGSNIAVTAAHVVRDASKIQVMLSGREEDSIAVGKPIIHEQYDIALLRLPKANRPFLSLTASSSDRVRVLGFPNVEDGMVESSGEAKPNDIWLLHKADTTGGHSGGPVLTPAGGAAQVIALHVSGFDENLNNQALLLREELREFVDKNIKEWN